MYSPGWFRLLPAQLRRRLDGRLNLIAMIENSGWLIFDKFVRMLLGLAVSVWVARYLGPAQFGELAYALAYIALFQAVATLGLDGIVVRDIARDKSAAGTVLGTAFSLRLAAGILCWLSAVGSMALINGLDSRSVMLVALAGGALVFQAADTVDLWFQSQSQSRRTVLPKLAAYLVSNGIKVALILGQAPLWGFAVVMALEALLAALGLIISYFSYPCREHWKSVSLMAHQLLAEGWPFMLSGVSIMIYMRIDQIMIREILGERELGIYAAILPLATVWQFIPMILASSLAPFVARKKKEGDKPYWDALEMIFRKFALLSWIVCVPIVLFGGYFVDMVYGDLYTEGGLVLKVYVLTNIFINLGVAQSLWLINERRSDLSLYKTILGAIVCIAANVILLPICGLLGVAISALLSMSVSAVFSNFIFSKRIFFLQIKALLLVKVG